MQAARGAGMFVDNKGSLSQAIRQTGSSGGGSVVLKRVSSTLGVVLALGMVHAQGQSTVPGKLSGELTVSPGGSATYRIPIEVPPGVAGMQPQLALSYNSQAGNGIMGMGWSIEGLSTITRCPKTLASDGVRGSVNFNTEDRFCLDGQRLINVSGVYGATGSEYRTELESFSRIMAYGAAAGSTANGPERFTVQTKAGLTMEYGATSDSRIEAQGRSVVRVWALSRMTDAKGNAIDYSYTETNANGQYLISAVSYAGRSVQFTYEDRPDKFNGYQAGSKVAQISRLRGIETRAGGNMVKRLEVSYLPVSLISDKSKPRSLTQCTSELQCLAPLQLVYQPSALASFSHYEHVAQDGVGGASFRVGSADLNGDGLADLLYWYFDASRGLVVRTKMGDGAGGFDRREFLAKDGIGGVGHNIHAVDINGDGITDLLYRYFDATRGLVVRSKIGDGNGNFGHREVVLGDGPGGAHYSLQPADINGDGRVDLLYWQYDPARGLVIRSKIGDGTGGFGHYETVPGDGVHGTNYGIHVLDINGDGLTDLLYWYFDPVKGLVVRSKLGDGTGRFGHYETVLGDGIGGAIWSVQPTDLNGDGIVDLLYWFYDPTRGLVARTKIGDGTGKFVASEFVLADGVGGVSYAIQAVDMNGDGFADILYWYFDPFRGLVVRLKLGDGTGRFQHQELVLQDGIGGSHHAIEVTDINGDGVMDLLYRYFDPVRGLVIRSKINAFQDGGRLQAISQHNQIQASIQYASLSARGNPYTKERGSVYPKVDLQPPLQVVSSVSQPNGAGGMNTTRYSYGGLKIEHTSDQYPSSGRGLLGFRWMKTLEEATGIETFTDFSQSWPTIGQVVKSETRLAGAVSAGLLKQSTHTYGCHQTAAAAGSGAPASPMATCGPWAPGKVYFPFLLSSIEDSWDLDGTAMPRLSTSYAYAGYAEQVGGVRQFGDPTQVQVDIHQNGALKHRKTTVNEYHPARTAAGLWQLGRLKRASVTSSQY